MSDAELQEEEREVLSSIYDGDPAFKQLTSTTFQYKVQKMSLWLSNCYNLILIQGFPTSQ